MIGRLTQLKSAIEAMQKHQISNYFEVSGKFREKFKERVRSDSLQSLEVGVLGTCHSVETTRSPCNMSFLYFGDQKGHRWRNSTFNSDPILLH